LISGKKIVKELVKNFVTKISEWIAGGPTCFGSINIYDGGADFFDSNNQRGSTPILFRRKTRGGIKQHET
jgi:hypothetical protein